MVGRGEHRGERRSKWYYLGCSELWGPRGSLFLMSEAPLYVYPIVCKVHQQWYYLGCSELAEGGSQVHDQNVLWYRGGLVFEATLKPIVE